LFGGFGVRHEEIESVESATYDQGFGCDSGMDEPPGVLDYIVDSPQQPEGL
jgi:hypothetical protein